MRSVTVKASRTYEVQIGRGLLQQAGTALKALLPAARTVMVVSDDTVFSLWSDPLLRSLKESGYEIKTFVFPHGEPSKTTDTVVSLWNALAEAGLTRSDCMIALGGGVVGDLTGFAAATYLRGIPFLQCPTTLLAMVDSSVGGKTGADLAAGKNLVGAFNQPIGVLCDVDTLSTLPRDVLTDGCAEVIKYGYINDTELLATLEQTFFDEPEAVIARCVEDKRALVEADERDTGARQLLNLGHTAGHAIEICANFEISHGSAVAIGMLLMAKAAVAEGLCDPAVLPHMQRMLTAYGLPLDCPFTAAQLAAVAIKDKKRSGSSITLVLPRAIGESVLHRIPVDALESFFEKATER